MQDLLSKLHVGLSIWFVGGSYKASQLRSSSCHDPKSTALLCLLSLVANGFMSEASCTWPELTSCCHDRSHSIQQAKGKWLFLHFHRWRNFVCCIDDLGLAICHFNRDKCSGMKCCSLFFGSQYDRLRSNVFPDVRLMSIPSSCRSRKSKQKASKWLETFSRWPIDLWSHDTGHGRQSEANVWHSLKRKFFWCFEKDTF